MRIHFFFFLLISGTALLQANDNLELYVTYSLSGQQMYNNEISHYPDGLYIRHSSGGNRDLIVVCNGHLVGIRNSDPTTLRGTEDSGFKFDWNAASFSQLSSSNGTCEFPTATMHVLLDDMKVLFLQQYGSIASDSIDSRMQKFHAMVDSGTFIMPVTSTVQFTPDTTSYSSWLNQTFAGASTTADSIENLCTWIGENYPYSEYDTLSETLSADSIYRMVSNGLMFGNCGDYSNFLAKIALDFSNWGIPVILNSRANVLISGGGTEPSHTCVGFMRHTGNLWCIADPTLGGIIRDSLTSEALSLFTIQKWLYMPEKAGRITIKKVSYSNSDEGICVFTQGLVDTIGITYYEISATNERGFVRAHWRSFDDPSRFSLSIPYWKARAYARMTFLNVYGDIVFPFSNWPTQTTLYPHTPTSSNWRLLKRLL